jgi:hypothetical protein
MFRLYNIANIQGDPCTDLEYNIAHTSRTSMFRLYNIANIQGHPCSGYTTLQIFKEIHVQT